MTIERVGVVGAGLMGSGIAEVCARAGLDVVVREVDAAACERGRGRIVGSLDRGVRSGKLAEADRDEALARLAFPTDFAVLADRPMGGLKMRSAVRRITRARPSSCGVPRFRLVPKRG